MTSLLSIIWPFLVAMCFSAAVFFIIGPHWISAAFIISGILASLGRMSRTNRDN